MNEGKHVIASWFSWLACWWPHIHITPFLAMYSLRARQLSSINNNLNTIINPVELQQVDGYTMYLRTYSSSTLRNNVKETKTKAQKRTTRKRRFALSTDRRALFLLFHPMATADSQIFLEEDNKKKERCIGDSAMQITLSSLYDRCLDPKENNKKLTLAKNAVPKVCWTAHQTKERMKNQSILYTNKRGGEKKKTQWLMTHTNSQNTWLISRLKMPWNFMRGHPRYLYVSQAHFFKLGGGNDILIIK